jgi:hypothetical protein
MNDKAKMHAVIEWRPLAEREPNWVSIADVTELVSWGTPGVIGDLCKQDSVFESQTRQRVSSLVSEIISCPRNTWGGNYYISYRKKIAEVIPATRDIGTWKACKMICALMKAAEEVWDGTTRLVVFYVEPARR